LILSVISPARKLTVLDDVPRVKGVPRAGVVFSRQSGHVVQAREGVGLATVRQPLLFLHGLPHAADTVSSAAQGNNVRERQAVLAVYIDEKHAGEKHVIAVDDPPLLLLALL